MLRAAFLHILEGNQFSNQSAFEAAILRNTLEDTAALLVAALLRQYRAHPRLFYVLIQFLANHAGTPFATKASQMIHSNVQLYASVLLHHRDRIRHPKPQLAATFAVLATTSTIEIAVLEPGSLWNTALPLSDKAFNAELTRNLLGYLRRKA